MGQILLTVRCLPSPGFTEYYSIFGHTNSLHVQSYKAKVPVSIDGTLGKLHVKLTAAPGAGKSRSFRVYKNDASTLLYVTLSDSETEETCETTVAVAAGDTLYIRTTTTSGATASYADLSIYFATTVAFESHLSGSRGLPDEAVAFTPLVGSGGGSGAGNEDLSQIVVSQGATISDLRVIHNTAPGSGGTFTHTLRVNEVDTDLSVTVSGTSTTGSDLINSVTLSIGDRICIGTTHTGTPAFPYVGFSVKVNGLTNNFYIGGYDHIVAVTEQTCSVFGLYGIYYLQVMADAMMAKSIYVRQHTDYADKTMTYTLRKDGVDTDLTLSLASTQEGVAAIPVYIESGSLITLRVTASAMPPGDNVEFIFGFTCESLVDISLDAPTLITNPCTDIAETSLTANGDIANKGGWYCTRRGFCYLQGTTGDPTVADSTEYEDGTFDVGVYSLGLTGLTSWLPYRVRSYAINPFGTSYGNTVGTLYYPSDTMARVSSVRRIYRPGLYRMEVALGDLGFDWDVSEAAMKKITEGVAEPETPTEPPVLPTKPPTEEFLRELGISKATQWEKYLAKEGLAEWPTTETATPAVTPVPTSGIARALTLIETITKPVTSALSPLVPDVIESAIGSLWSGLKGLFS